MLAPLSAGSQRRQSSQIGIIPAPFGGWNASDDITDMAAEDAVVLDNLIPGDANVGLRNGYSATATGLGGPVLTLMEYNAPSGTPKLFGSVAASIYDVTGSGAVGAAVVTGLTNGRWRSSMFATAGGTFLVIANGADSVRNYDGTTWTTPAITGVSSATLTTVTPHVSRLWFVQEDTMKVWYLPTLAIAGAATSIDFGGLSKLGGKLMAMGSWTRDSGVGVEDVAVFITSRGEAHIYSGSDPSSATTWARVGTFKIAEPIGRNCLIKVGGDLGILTSQGLVPLSGILSRAESAQGRVAITDKIRNAFSAAYTSAGTLNGWQVLEYPLGKLLLINVPVIESTTQRQFVMNANTGKWCRFTGINAGCWSLLGTSLYFGGNNGTVYRYTGSSDAGADIAAKAVSAFGYLRSNNTKNFRRILARFFGPSGYRPQVGLRLDYSDEEYLSPASTFATAGAEWDVSAWDTTAWAPPDAVNQSWQGVSGQGTTASVVIAIQSQEPISYNGAKLEFEIGDHL